MSTYYTMKELCERLDVHRQTILRWRARKLFRIGFKFGRDWRFPKDAVAAWEKKRQRG